MVSDVVRFFAYIVAVLCGLVFLGLWLPLLYIRGVRALRRLK